jgi:hypothetical protein
VIGTAAIFLSIRWTDAIQELLGKWHDGRVAEKYIAERKIEKGTNRMEKKRFDRIKAQLHKENSSLIKRTTAENRKLLKKLICLING